MEKGLWHYLTLWRERFPRRRPLRWRGTWLQNDYCSDCRYCCGPQDPGAPFPMALLPGQIRPDLGQDFYLLNAHTACLDERGCKAHTVRGCRLLRTQRPVSCGLFPLVPANGSLYLYKVCPAVMLTPLVRLADLGLAAAGWLTSFSVEDLRRISLQLPVPLLAECYISLNLQLYDSQGVRLRQG